MTITREGDRDVGEAYQAETEAYVSEMIHQSFKSKVKHSILWHVTRFRPITLRISMLTWDNIGYIHGYIARGTHHDQINGRIVTSFY